MGGGGRREGRQGKVKGGEVHSGMERSLALLAALSGPGRRAQPVGKAVGMLAWIGEAMTQVLRKVGERARPAGWAPPCVLSWGCTKWSPCRRVVVLVGHRRASSPHGKWGDALLVAAGRRGAGGTRSRGPLHPSSSGLCELPGENTRL